jgi:predicted O-methyltransferase YrrM
MPLDTNFYKAVEPLHYAGMGTEHVAPLLYSLVRMTRPCSVLEVGLGYTTPFIAQALADNISEFQEDRRILTDPVADDERRLVLAEEYFQADYSPVHHAIDDFSDEDSSGKQALQVIEALDLESVVQVHKGDFHGLSRQMDQSAFPLDLVWFDCGGLPEYVDFIEEYWRMINPDHGMLLLHFTYSRLSFVHDGVENVALICGPVANEIKRQQMHAGVNASFEVLSLVEPHKRRQGSVTMIRKLPWTSMCRDRDFEQEVLEISGKRSKPIIKLQ